MESCLSGRRIRQRDGGGSPLSQGGALYNRLFSQFLFPNNKPKAEKVCRQRQVIGQSGRRNCELLSAGEEYEKEKEKLVKRKAEKAKEKIF